jgi:glycosyltransferase involved in cell wall biosynthesis
MKKIKRLVIAIRNYYLINNSGLFDPHYYLANNPDVRRADINPLKHYVKHGGLEGRNPSEIFDAAFYINAYQDVRAAGINPLAHFILYGQKEGRRGLVKSEKSIQTPKLVRTVTTNLKNFSNLFDDGLMAGQKKYDENKELVVFVSHESSATGAPILGYNIVDGLNEWYNVVHIVIKKSKIADFIPKNCYLYIDDIFDDPKAKSHKILKELNNKYKVKAVILNSVETVDVLYESNNLMLPTVCLVHEFSNYTIPVGKMIKILLYATEIITPASIITNSMLEEFKTVTGVDASPKHISELTQGKLPFLPNKIGEEETVKDLYKKLKISNQDNTKIIVACGTVHLRKGVDLFLSVARYIKQNYKGDCKFIWVGDGYDPFNDAQYSVYLKRDIQLYGLKDDFIFLKHQKSLDTVFKIADVFCLTSRMDPFPNVAIDAMEANLPIAYFRDISGIEKFLQEHNAHYLLADYLDSYQLAEKIVAYFKGGAVKQSVNAQLVKKKLSFDYYINAINALINKAEKTTLDTKKAIKKILVNKMFDTIYHGIDQAPELAAYHYVSLFKKGLYKYDNNPMPGFSQLQWILDHGLHPTLTPLEQAIEKGIKQTHDCKILPLSKKDIKLTKFKYAVHLHLYYTDLADYFKNYFKNLVGNFDLYITIVNKLDKEIVYEAFKGCGASYVEVVVVENIGRDIGPMIFNLRKQLTTKDYELVGHFHSKKTLDVMGGSLGNNWREYLMQNLVGENRIAESILTLFNNPKVGLVFAEDKHKVDIGDNRKYMNDLCQMLDFAQITNTHIFPLGNMFWARIDAIKQFFELDPKKILKSEPMPIDGSYIHALERITPHLVQKNGFKFLTVYKNGTTWN